MILVEKVEPYSIEYLMKFLKCILFYLKIRVKFVHYKIYSKTLPTDMITSTGR